MWNGGRRRTPFESRAVIAGMARSILGYVGLGATLIFALPAALFGLELLVQGRTVVGAGLVVTGVLMVVVEEHITTAEDLPGLVAEQTVGRLVGTDDDES